MSKCGAGPETPESRSNVSFEENGQSPGWSPCQIPWRTSIHSSPGRSLLSKSCEKMWNVKAKYIESQGKQGGKGSPFWSFICSTVESTHLSSKSVQQSPTQSEIYMDNSWAVKIFLWIRVFQAWEQKYCHRCRKEKVDGTEAAVTKMTQLLQHTSAAMHSHES